MRMRNVYIGLGSNIGDRESTINSAITAVEEELIETRSIKTLTISNIYGTAAWGMPEGTPSFLNCVICIETNLELNYLLDVLLNIEIANGRVRNTLEGYSSRTLDCDILVAGEEIVSNERLEVPHPIISTRRFVLQPLSDLDPTLKIPGLENSVSELLINCSDEPKVTLWDPTHT